MDKAFSISLLFWLCGASAQEPMHAFYNADSTLTGYRESNGSVVFEPRFAGSIHPARRVEHIAAVIEETPKGYQKFHITRQGKTFGRDSIYMQEAMLDCESEGHIRFRDPRNGLIGLFNRHGKVAVPARYNYLGPVTNGYAQGLIDARVDSTDIEHPRFEGGRLVLVDTLGQIAIENFSYAGQYDLFSLRKVNMPDTNGNHQTFRATDGAFISLIRFEHEFNSWIRGLMPKFSKKRLLRSSHPTLAIWDNGWKKVNSGKFISQHFMRLRESLSEFAKNTVERKLFENLLNPFIFDTPEFDRYLDNCGEPKQNFPVFTIAVPRPGGQGGHEDHFEFLRTDDGYKLISVALAQ